MHNPSMMDQDLGMGAMRAATLRSLRAVQRKRKSGPSLKPGKAIQPGCAYPHSHSFTGWAVVATHAKLTFPATVTRVEGGYAYVSHVDAKGWASGLDLRGWYRLCRSDSAR